MADLRETSYNSNDFVRGSDTVIYIDNVELEAAKSSGFETDLQIMEEKFFNKKKVVFSQGIKQTGNFTVKYIPSNAKHQMLVQNIIGGQNPDQTYNLKIEKGAMVISGNIKIGSASLNLEVEDLATLDFSWEATGNLKIGK